MKEIDLHAQLAGARKLRDAAVPEDRERLNGLVRAAEERIAHAPAASQPPTVQSFRQLEFEIERAQQDVNRVMAAYMAHNESTRNAPSGTQEGAAWNEALERAQARLDAAKAAKVRASFELPALLPAAPPPPPKVQHKSRAPLTRQADLDGCAVACRHLSEKHQNPIAKVMLRDISSRLKMPFLRRAPSSVPAAVMLATVYVKHIAQLHERIAALETKIGVAEPHAAAPTPPKNGSSESHAIGLKTQWSMSP